MSDAQGRAVTYGCACPRLIWATRLRNLYWLVMLALLYRFVVWVGPGARKSAGRFLVGDGVGPGAVEESRAGLVD